MDCKYLPVLFKHSKKEMRLKHQLFTAAVRDKANFLATAIVMYHIDVNTVDSNCRSLLWFAVAYDRVSAVAVLLLAKANVNKADAYGDSPLHIAVRHASFEVIRALLEAGAQIDRLDDGGQTALYWAVHDKRQKVVDLLLSFNADVNKAAGCGMPPI